MTRPRLVLASAHFPPNFVSGGTLVPERQARGFALRGWDVSVFAGHLERGRPSYETWDDEVDGLPIRWIEIEAFTSWADPRNFDNPPVSEAFQRYLAERRPDVVHLHSLQAVGAGLVPAAIRSGARTVVTMHDFWWCCGRQFLVDPGGTPCSVVVDASACPCAVDTDWRDDRHEHLLRLLAGVDLVLAPSAVAAEVLRANGVPGDRLRVDENGLAALPATLPPTRDHAGPVTFRYAGGADPLKGAQVVHRAARELVARRPQGWRLVVHGDERALRELGPWPAEVVVEAPFDPVRIDEVMAASDVLVVPSLARESHSLITREALLRGVPVICSDSLGPEQVVQDGRNGLVVPTGDHHALAGAMELALDRPDRVAAWREAAPSVPVRLEEDRLDELDERLRQLARSRPAGSHPAGRSDHADIRQVLFVAGIDGAPLRYRAQLPAEALATQGVSSEVRHYRDPEVPSLALAADAVVLYRVPATDQVLDLVRRLRIERPAVPLLFDVDDLIFDPDLTAEVPALRRLEPAEAELWLEGVRRYRTTMEACDAYIGSTELLCSDAAQLTGLPVHRFANGVGRLLGAASDAELRRPRRPGPLRVGYLSGTKTHDGDWGHVEEAVVEVMRAHQDAELWLGGLLTPSARVAELGSRLDRLPMVPWTELPAILRDLDVNLAPLEPVGRFNEAKSAIKWLEAALCETPTIAARTQPFGEAIEHGVNGLLADDVADWQAGLDRLLSDDLLRARMGARARRDALLRWPPRLQGERYLAILEDARRGLVGGRSERRSTWAPVTRSEPPEPTSLSPYHADGPVLAPPAGGGRAERLRRAVLVRARRLRTAWRDEGPARATSRAARALGRDGRRLVRGLLRRASRP